MAKVLVTEDYLKNIGDAIRSKTDTEDMFTPAQMATAISNIKSGESALWTTDGRLYYKNMTFPEETEKLGVNLSGILTSALAGINEIESVVIPDSVTSIINGMFYTCKGLKNVTFGKSLTSVGQIAFRDCTAIETVDLINTSLTTLNTWAFRGCTSLTTVALPNTLTSANASFAYCTNLENVTLQNGFLCTIDFSASTQFSANSIIVMLNALGEVPKQETRTLTLGATNLEKLTDTQKQIATDKGWTLA